ncbi:MAG TPA: twin-arginine translocase TatA/TatE family subunit [Candidatus Sulfotelmatobacter sp.]
MIEGLFQPMHLLMIIGIALLVFGPKKLPELGKGLGDGIRGFKSAMSGDKPSDDALATNKTGDANTKVEKKAA